MDITKKVVIKFLKKFKFKYVYKNQFYYRYQIELKDIDKRLITLFSDILNISEVTTTTIDIYYNVIKITSGGKYEYIYNYEIPSKRQYRGLKLFLIYNK